MEGNGETGKTQEVQLARKTIGFWPQVDLLLDLLTGRQTSSMFGRLQDITADILVSSSCKDTAVSATGHCLLSLPSH